MGFGFLFAAEGFEFCGFMGVEGFRMRESGHEVFNRMLGAQVVGVGVQI